LFSPLRFTILLNKKDKDFRRKIARLIQASPGNLALYKLAMVHSSQATETKRGFKESNERLEYLGDAILGAIVADYLFKKFPFKNEGFLTELRSKIVKRESLNQLAVKIGLNELVNFEGEKSKRSYKSLYGDAMEAFLGAIFLDKGYKFTERFVKRMIISYYDLQNLVDTPGNYKSLIIEWTQKNGKSIRFDNGERSKGTPFSIDLMIDNSCIASGYGLSKKKAEQDAARKACKLLEIDYQA
jgi:ribonuclease-3